MAIVVAIIALMTGGILTAKNFVAQAELRALMSESQTTIDAFNQFKGKYHAIPGDFIDTPPRALPGAVNGDGNGVIRAGAADVNIGNGELFGAFQHLAMAGYLKGSYSGISATCTPTPCAVADLGNNVPQSVVSGVGYLFNHADTLSGTLVGDSTYFDGKYGHVLWIAGSTPGDLPRNGFLIPSSALALDAKFDDGLPGTGIITTYKPAASPSTTDCASTNDRTTARYNTADATVGPVNTSQVCYFFINIPGS